MRKKFEQYNDMIARLFPRNASAAASLRAVPTDRVGNVPVAPAGGLGSTAPGLHEKIEPACAVSGTGDQPAQDSNAQGGLPAVVGALGSKSEEVFARTAVRKVLSRTLTFQVTDACNLCCTYCYQINKGVRRMKFETAKKMIDMLLEHPEKLRGYLDPSISPAIILEFIGGEPFLEVELIDRIVDYFILRCIMLKHPWATRFCISICSNGVLYFTEPVQRFLRKHKNRISFSITIDGSKALHDSCRIFPSGEGSYDKAVAAAKDWMSKGYYMGSKITIAPGNLPYLTDAILHMVSLGYTEINANCVYEKGWELCHAQEFYRQLKAVADYFIEHDLVETHYLSLFSETFFRPKEPTDNDNWCGGNGEMLSVDPDGYLYPCIRYMESSLGHDQPPLMIGDVEHGIGAVDLYAKRVKELQSITRRSQSTDECFDCPIAEGCSWCTAYNYQQNGTPNSRCTYICVMHKARSLANCYYWNKWYRKSGEDKRLKLHCSKEWALPIVGEEEYRRLKELEESL